MTATVLTHQILAASFPTPDGASKAAAAVIASQPGKIANTAVISVNSSGSPKVFETKDWGTGRGAIVGGAIGLIGGPLGVLAGSGIGVLASRLRDAGFKDTQLAALGESLRANESAVVFDIATESVAVVTDLLTPLGATQIVGQPIDTSVAALFASSGMANSE